MDVSAVSYESGREALQLATDGGSSIQDIASLLKQEAEDHSKMSLTAFHQSDGWSDHYSCDHHTALEIAASAGHIDAVVRLLDAGADPNAPVHMKGTSALEAAAARGRLVVVQKLLELGAHPNHDAESSGASPLEAAAQAGHVEICEVLIQNGADVSIFAGGLYHEVSSAIKAAVETSNSTLLELFLGQVQNAADEFDPDDLDVAIAEGQQEDSRRLLQTKEFLDRAQISLNSALSAAARSSNMLILQRVLDAGAHIFGSEPYYTNAIAAAISGGQLEAADKLIQTAYDQNILTPLAVPEALTPGWRSITLTENLRQKRVMEILQSAVDTGNITLIEHFLQNCADATMMIDMMIDIRRAAAAGYLDVLTLLFESEVLERVDPASKKGFDPELKYFSALHLAAQNGHQKVVDFLLSKGADIDEPLYLGGDMGGATALQLAVASGHLAVAKQLIDAGADVNGPCQESGSPLQAAIRTGDTAMLELLLAAGAAVDVFTGCSYSDLHKKSALSVASEVKNPELVSRLLSIMSPDVARRAAHMALREAAKNHHSDVVRQLLQLHPDVNETTEGRDETTLLQMAAVLGNSEIIEMLLSEGADVNLNPSGGWKPTALQSVSEQGNLAAVDLLLAAGAEVNVTGSTAPPLLLAIRGGHVQVFQRLLAAGADIHATAYRGQTMLEAAEYSGVADMQDSLRAALYSRPPPQIDQPLDQGTGPLCETCRMAPLADLFRGRLQDLSPLTLHPSLTALRASAAAGCPFCCFLWKRLGPTAIYLPQPSPVELTIGQWYEKPIKCYVACYVAEPFGIQETEPECLRIEFPFYTGPKPDPENFQEERVPITEDTSSPSTYQQIRDWLDTCNNKHPQCRAPSGNASLPTRLIYLDTSGETSLSNPVQASFQPRLVSTNGMDYSECKYIALSYRWPEDFPVEAKSSRDNVREQMRGLNTFKLPQTFNDLFQVAVRLGINYVWIDALCIIQDDTEDWNREAALMIQVYRYAEFTVAAAVPPTNPDLGLFRHGDPSDIPSVILPGVRDPQEDGSGQDVVVMKPQKEAYGDSPLVSRGWCFQEREISQRIVHYTETQVLWECRTLRASEGLPDGRPDKPRRTDEDWNKRIFDVANELDHEEFNVEYSWHRAVEDYSGRNLTVFTDKLPALSGLAAVIRENKPVNCRYLAGLWEDNFLSDLLWCSSDLLLSSNRLSWSPSDRGATVTNTRHPGYVAPTWSWASVAGPVWYRNFIHGHHPVDDYNPNGNPILKILDICVRTTTNDTLGAVRYAVLTCTAALVPGVLWGRDGNRPGYGVRRNNGDPIGTMYFDVDPKKYDGEELQVVFCIHMGCDPENDWYGPGLVVLPTGNRENEYRRIGMMASMKWGSGFDTAPIKEITII